MAKTERSGRKSPEKTGVNLGPVSAVLPDVVAAGAVVIRDGGDEVLLVHRPAYDDWSFPKGKLDRGEHVTACAVREVEEETGLRVRLGVPLGDQRYDLRTGRMKTVHYWVARPVGDDDLAAYEPNSEVDRVEWVDWATAARRLSYDHDRDTLASAREQRRRTRTLVVLRHGQAMSRKAWEGDDRLRPLLPDGEKEATYAAAVLAAYDISVVATSTSTRCLQTVVPYAEQARVPVRRHVEVSQEEATQPLVTAVVEELLQARRAVLCSHRPVFPMVFDALALESPGVPTPKLRPGAMLVLHHRRGQVLATELWAPPTSP